MDFSHSFDSKGLARLRKLGGPDFVCQMIDLFLEEAPERLAAARSAASAGNLIAVSDAAHSLKSSALNFGATALGGIAGKIELQTRANQGQNVPELLSEMEDAYAATIVWLKNERDALKL